MPIIAKYICSQKCKCEINMNLADELLKTRIMIISLAIFYPFRF